MRRMTVYVVIGLVIVLTGLLFPGSATWAIWLRAGDSTEIFEVTRVCRDGFSIRGASNVAGYDKPVYARMFDLFIDRNNIAPGSFADPGPAAVPGGVVATGIVPIPTVANPQSVDGGPISQYVGDPVDILWSAPLDPNIPYVAVFWGTDPNQFPNHIAGFIILAVDTKNCYINESGNGNNGNHNGHNNGNNGNHNGHNNGNNGG